MGSGYSTQLLLAVRVQALQRDTTMQEHFDAYGVSSATCENSYTYSK